MNVNVWGVVEDFKAIVAAGAHSSRGFSPTLPSLSRSSPPKADRRIEAEASQLVR
jgi:hypothetical protein